MQKKTIVTLLAIALLLVAAVLYYSFRKSPDSVKNSKADYNLSATQLVEEFSDDEGAANTKYLDKIIVTEGLVVGLEKVQNDKTIISLEGNFIGNVSCSFANKELNNKQITKGNKISIKGKCSGFIMDVVLTKCSIVE